MTKARTKGAARRSKPGRPPVEDVEREPSGKVSRNPEATRNRREAAMRTVIEQRARHMGILPPEPVRLPAETPEEYQDRRAAREGMIRAATPLAKREWAGCSVGQAIADQPDVVVLWEAVKLIRARRQAYCFAIGAPEERAKVAALMVAPSREPPIAEARIVPSEPLSEEEAEARASDLWYELRDVLLAHHPLAVRFTVDRICAEVPGADAAPVPKAPVIAILRHVHKRMIAEETS